MIARRGFLQLLGALAGGTAIAQTRSPKPPSMPAPVKIESDVVIDLSRFKEMHFDNYIDDRGKYTVAWGLLPHGIVRCGQRVKVTYKDDVLMIGTVTQVTYSFVPARQTTDYAHDEMTIHDDNTKGQYYAACST